MNKAILIINTDTAEAQAIKENLSSPYTKIFCVWEQRHKRYLREHKRATYTTLLTSGKLNSYLADIDEQAEEMFFSVGKRTC